MRRERFWLYRAWAGGALDVGGLLLYVGISNNPARRFREHAGAKWWWGEWVDLTTVHELGTCSRCTAERIEAHVIRAERPLFNVTHSQLTPRDRLDALCEMPDAYWDVHARIEATAERAKAKTCSRGNHTISVSDAISGVLDTLAHYQEQT